MVMNQDNRENNNMFGKILNSNADLNNLSEEDVILDYKPTKLVDKNGIQYPLSYFYKSTAEEKYDLFGILEIVVLEDYEVENFDIELQDVRLTKIHSAGSPPKIYKTLIAADKPQEEIDVVLLRRGKLKSIDYRSKRKEAYIQSLSPEKDPISTLGDVVDALFQAVYHGDVEKLNTLAPIIDEIKLQYPKPVDSANTA